MSMRTRTARTGVSLALRTDSRNDTGIRPRVDAVGGTSCNELRFDAALTSAAGATAAGGAGRDKAIGGAGSSATRAGFFDVAIGGDGTADGGRRLESVLRAAGAKAVRLGDVAGSSDSPALGAGRLEGIDRAVGVAPLQNSAASQASLALRHAGLGLERVGRAVDAGAGAGLGDVAGTVGGAALHGLG